MIETHETDEGHDAGARHDRPVSRDELVSTVEYALQKKQGLWPKGRLPGHHDRFKPLACAIVDHMELCKYRCVGRMPGRGPSANDLLTDEDLRARLKRP